MLLHDEVERTSPNTGRGGASESRGKSYITLQRLVIEALPRQELITDYNSSSATEIPAMVD